VAVATAVLATLIGTAVVPGNGIDSVASLLAGLGLVLMIAVTGAVGLVVTWHQPHNRVGWLLLIAALLFPLGLNAADYSTYYISLGSWGRPAGELAFLLEPLWISPVVLFPLIILLFPDGRLPSPRWRWLVRAAIGAGAAVVGYGAAETLGAMAHHSFRVTAGGTLAPQHWLPSWPGTVITLAVLAVLATAWLSAIGRQLLAWRRSSGDRRQQLKWLACGGVVFGVAVVPSLAITSMLWEVATVGFAALPLSIGLGILRYRLYDIDRIISRTLAYALVTGLLIGLYAGLVLLATQVLRLSSPVSVAAATLLAAAAFNPLRRRVQARVDRRFNRARYDADAAVRVFAARLAGTVDLDGIRADLARTVHTTLQPAHLSVWVPGEHP
jgi:MFS family permease